LHFPDPFPIAASVFGAFDPRWSAVSGAENINQFRYLRAKSFEFQDDAKVAQVALTS
jgi:hypothetical protein